MLHWMPPSSLQYATHNWQIADFSSRKFRCDLSFSRNQHPFADSFRFPVRLWMPRFVRLPGDRDRNSSAEGLFIRETVQSVGSRRVEEGFHWDVWAAVSDPKAQFWKLELQYNTHRYAWNWHLLQLLARANCLLKRIVYGPIGMPSNHHYERFQYSSDRIYWWQVQLIKAYTRSS